MFWEISINQYVHLFPCTLQQLKSQSGFQTEELGGRAVARLFEGGVLK